MGKRCLALLLVLLLSVSEIPAMALDVQAASDVQETDIQETDVQETDVQENAGEVIENEEQTDVQAKEEVKAVGSEQQKITEFSMVHVNPLYADIITEESILEDTASAAGAITDEEPVYYSDIQELVGQLRESMVARTEKITLGYQTTESFDADQLLTSISDQAMEHTGDSEEEDYLSGQYAGWLGNLSGYSYEGVSYLTINYVPVYYTNAEQEAEIEDPASEVLPLNTEDAELAAVELQASEVSVDEIKLNWTKSEEAEGYIIYSVDTAGNKTELARITGNNVLAYSVYGLAPNTGYSYLISPYRMVDSTLYEGAESNTVSIKTRELDAVTLKVSSVNYNQIELTWTKNSKATGYNIYRKNSTGQYAYLTNIKSGSTLTFTSVGLAVNTTYSYKIAPIIRINDKDYVGPMSSEVSATTSKLPTVTLKAESVDYNQIKLTWNKCKDAVGYNIYRKNSEGKYVYLTNIKSGNTVTYTGTGLLCNTTYSYKVAPIVKISGKNYVGILSNAASARPKLLTAKISAVKDVNYKTLQISWGKIAGANGYDIYRSSSANSGYKLLKRINSGNTVTYNDATVTPNSTHYYKVQAFRIVDGTRIYGNLSSAKSGKSMFTKVTGLKASALDYTTIKLSWDKVTGATKYQVYYSTSKSSGYKCLTTVTGNDYTWTSPTCGQTYYFKVRALKVEKGKTIYGYFSSVVGKTAVIGRPTATAEKQNYSTIKISWNEVAGAQNYQVYWSDSRDGTYKKLTTTTTTSCLHTERALGITYYYKVRAIRQNSVSAFCSVVSAKTSLGKITGLKTGRFGEGIKVSWNAADGATKYNVYRSTSESGTYTLLATVISTNFVDPNVRSSKVYYYQIKGVRGTVKTEPSGPVSGKVQFTRQGIDVSEYQGSIDWNAVKNDGIDFAMLRIVKGHTDYMSTDARFKEYYKKATDAGLMVGVYRYSYATSVAEARMEAYKVLEVLDGRALDYPIVLDMEDESLLAEGITNSTRSSMIFAFKKIIEDAGYSFALYTNLKWMNNYLDMDKLEDVDIWLARWRDYDQGPGYTGKGNLVMWQYTNSGSVNGISGKVDLNVSY